MSGQKHLIAGSLFILAGILFFILNISLFDAFWPLPLTGMSLLMLYFFSERSLYVQNEGVLLTALSSLSLFMYDTISLIGIKNDKPWLFLFLFLSFLALFFISAANQPARAEPPIPFWPLIPAFFFLMIGIEGFLSIALWPFILLAAGILLLFTGKAPF
ncbi:hypothetical protein [Bacillus marinisedimentorum]|uniref:hypothetical protein n=1 Tax=Bacillus marinisedimentorum TaxID=1821260 RepID=UPI0008727494|nr:hypothetical protein [Bacillus marinisedimentorum]